MKKKDLRHQYPLLSEFAAAYLHQDIDVDFRTPNEAATAYVKALSATERNALAEESAGMRKAARDWTAAEVNRVWGELGSSWMFNSGQELDSLLLILGQSKTRPS